MAPLYSKKLVHILAALFILIGISINLSYAATVGSISGAVTDASDAPLSGVTISLCKFAGGYVVVATTDASGNYTINNLITGLYYIQFTKPGMMTSWNGGATSQQTATPIALTAPNALTGINAKLRVGARISGTVIDANNAPLPSSVVILYNSSGTSVGITNTDASGNFLFTDLASGTYYIKFLTSGMPPVWYGGATTQLTATPITTIAPNTITGITGQLGSGGSISGTVTDTTGTPQSSTSVTLYNSAKNRVDWGWGTIATDPSGYYSFRGLSSGTYYIQFSASGMIPSWYGGETQQTASPITVTAPITTIGINGQLEAGGSISGTVTDVTHNPLSSVSVTLFDSTGSYVSVGNTATNSSGNYVLNGLASGTYYIQFFKTGIQTGWYDGAATQQTATPITVTAPNATTEIDVQLATTGGGGSISGTVTNADNIPLYGVSVFLNDSSGNEVIAQTSTDSSGNYTLSGLTSGTYYIQFYTYSYGMPSIWYGGVANQQTATPITVTAPNATTGINGKLGVGGSISGTVTIAANTPLPSARVSLYDSTGNFYLGVDADLSGNYLFSGLANGMYFIQFSTSGWPPVWYGGATSQQTTTPIIVTASNAITGINGNLQLGGSIKGTVMDVFNSPLSNVQVTLHDSAGISVINVSTDASGNYLVKGIADGTYYLQFFVNGMPPVWYGGSATWQGATPIVIAASNNQIGINGLIGVGGSISGTVLSAANSPFGFLRAGLYNAAGNMITIGRVDQDGSYSFRGLASGTYYVQIFVFFGYQAIWYGGATWQTAAPIPVTSPDARTGINVTYGGFTDSWIDCQVYGSGTVTSSPVGITCLKDNTAGCSVPFAPTQTVILNATPDSTSVFSGWFGDCSGTSSCSLDMSSARYVVAQFTDAPKAKVGNTGYISLNFAYAAASVSSEIHALDTVLTEDILMADNKTITLKGGYSADYSSRSGNPTILSGTLKIRNGKLNVDGLVLR